MDEMVPLSVFISATCNAVYIAKVNDRAVDSYHDIYNTSRSSVCVCAIIPFVRELDSLAVANCGNIILYI